MLGRVGLTEIIILLFVLVIIVPFVISKLRSRAVAPSLIEEIGKGNKICPFCGEAIKSVAIKCKHCQSMLSERRDVVHANHQVISSGTVNSFIGKTCPFCQYPIKSDAEVVICSECQIPHHQECWQENGGCTTFGCSGTDKKEQSSFAGWSKGLHDNSRIPTADDDISSGQEERYGLKNSIAGLLCYVLGWVSGIIIFIVAGDNKFVRFHAIQSIITFGALNILQILISILSTILVEIFVAMRAYTLAYTFASILGIMVTILWLVILALAIFLIVKAYQNETYRLPIAGKIAEKQLQ